MRAAGRWDDDPSGRRRGETGSVTAELALGLPAVVLALVVVLVVASAAVAQLRCADAARAAARAAALGESDAVVVQVVGELAGDDAAVVVTRSDGWVHVTVSLAVGSGALGLGSLTASSTASVPVEPGGDP